MSPEELVAELDECFRAFDAITGEHSIEKIKTIGDAYMCAGGLPKANQSHAVDVVRAALRVQEFMAGFAESRRAGGPPGVRGQDRHSYGGRWWQESSEAANLPTTSGEIPSILPPEWKAAGWRGRSIFPDRPMNWFLNNSFAPQEERLMPSTKERWKCFL